MRRCQLFILYCILSLTGCKESEQDSYFPLANYIESELKSIDSLPVAIIHYKSEGNELDTLILEKQEFRKTVHGLILNSIDSSRFSNQYNETVMEDVGNGLITLSYVTKGNEQALKNIDVYVNSGSSLVKRIYFERIDFTPTIEIRRKMLWSIGKELKITSILNNKDGITQSRTDRYTWGIDNE